jgi:hypothetical protein
LPTITIDDQVYKELKRMAEPFVDSPNDVLRRVFRLRGEGEMADQNGPDKGLPGDAEDRSVLTKGEWKTDRRGRPHFEFRIVNRTPDREFRIPILRALEEKDGRAPTIDILERVEELMRPRLKPIDYQPMTSGQIRWRSAANFERKHMALERVPLINPTSPRGIWEITDAGREYLKDTIE